jgi:hypothetical protein
VGGGGSAGRPGWRRGRMPVIDAVLAIRRLPEPKGFMELSPVGYMVEEPDGQGQHRFVLRSHASRADAVVRRLQEEPAALAPSALREWSVRLSLWAARRNRVVHVDLFGMRIEAAAGIGWFTLVEDRRTDIGEEPLDRFRRRVLAALEQPLGLT